MLRYLNVAIVDLYAFARMFRNNNANKLGKCNDKIHKYIIHHSGQGHTKNIELLLLAHSFKSIISYFVNIIFNSKPFWHYQDYNIGPLHAPKEFLKKFIYLCLNDDEFKIRLIFYFYNFNLNKSTIIDMNLMEKLDPIINFINKKNYITKEQLSEKDFQNELKIISEIPQLIFKYPLKKNNKHEVKKIIYDDLNDFCNCDVYDYLENLKKNL